MGVGAIYEVYIDVFAVNNFFVDLVALAAVRLFLKKNAKAGRVIIGALSGTIGNCAAFVICPNMAAYYLLVHFLLNPLVLYISFQERDRKAFFADLCAGYVAFLLAGGIMEWLYAGGVGFFPYRPAYLAVAVFFAVAALWGRQWLRSLMRVLEVRICQDGKTLCLPALADSGNLLHDPYTGMPVSMVDRRAYEAAYGAPGSVRLIPYESLGCRHGLLEAVTVEWLSFTYGKHRVRIQRAVLGLAEPELFRKKTYSMVINPQEFSGENKQHGH